MIRARFQLSVLVLFHLLLLGYPQLIKTFHVHHHDSVNSLHQQGVLLNVQQDNCPICNFEFISFIKFSASNLKVCLPAVEIEEFIFPHTIYPPVLFHFLLRAPPVA